MRKNHEEFLVYTYFFHLKLSREKGQAKFEISIPNPVVYAAPEYSEKNKGSGKKTNSMSVIYFALNTQGLD